MPLDWKIAAPAALAVYEGAAVFSKLTCPSVDARYIWVPLLVAGVSTGIYALGRYVVRGIDELNRP